LSGTLRSSGAVLGIMRGVMAVNGDSFPSSITVLVSIIVLDLAHCHVSGIAFIVLI
jgi:hypothetical protein